MHVFCKELAYSQLAAVIKTKTAEGMVPNFWQPRSISYDRTEPIIGAKVRREKKINKCCSGWSTAISLAVHSDSGRSYAEV